MATQIFFIFTPTWGDDPIWRAYFSNGLVQPPTRLLLHQSVGVDDTARRSSWTSLRSRVQWHVWSQPFKIECWRRLGSLGMRKICQVSKKMDYLKDLPFGYPKVSRMCRNSQIFWDFPLLQQQRLPGVTGRSAESRAGSVAAQWISSQGSLVWIQKPCGLATKLGNQLYPFKT